MITWHYVDVITFFIIIIFFFLLLFLLYIYFFFRDGGGLFRCYPDLAKDMRVSDFVRNYDATNGCTMRFGAGGFAIDGSLANVIKTYLVVQQADSDGKWLPTVWPNVKAQMELVFRTFDTSNDGMFRCEQQNTYDTAMQGPNTFIGSYWVVALKSTAAMATLMGEPDFAKQCSDRAALSAASI